MKPKLLVITGPTASGKTGAAIRLAQAVGGEIVGCDSMQIYRGMDIGTGKVTTAETCGIAHHMIDVVSPDCAYSVGQYKADAARCIADIVSRGRVPILVGGTGLYINALLSGMNFGEAGKTPAIREQLLEEVERYGAAEMYRRLVEVDPQSAARIHPNDIKRVTRALEIYMTTGAPKSRVATVQAESPYDYLLFVLQYADRDALYARIERRVDEMFAAGLVEEVRRLSAYRACQSMQAIGYKELIGYLDGLCGLEEAKETIKRNSRRYAKRQITFFKSMPHEKQYIDPKVQSLADHAQEIRQFLDR